MPVVRTWVAGLWFSAPPTHASLAVSWSSLSGWFVFAHIRDDDSYTGPSIHHCVPDSTETGCPRRCSHAPDGDEGHAGEQALQALVGFVLRVASAVVRQAHGLRIGLVAAHGGLATKIPVAVLGVCGARCAGEEVVVLRGLKQGGRPVGFLTS
jgi:hypothetical protein